MLKLIVYGEEFYNEETGEFNFNDEFVLLLEHSLVSLSKWESKYKKSFLSNNEKSLEETFGYVEAMIINEEYPEDILNRLKQNHFDEINAYIESSESATTFSNNAQGPQRRNSEVITSELIYYWMVAFNIPFECEKWNLNRLFTLIQICNIKNSNPKKMSKNEIMARNSALNEQRKAALGTTG
jgi:hypothetical protein